MKIIEDFAKNLCGAVQQEGEFEAFSLDGKANAQLKGLASKLAGIGINGSGVFKSEKYKNVLREQLGEELKNARSCRLKVFSTIFDSISQPQESEQINDQQEYSAETSIYPPEYAVVANRGYVERINNGERSISEMNMIRNNCRTTRNCKLVVAETWRDALRKARGH